MRDTVAQAELLAVAHTVADKVTLRVGMEGWEEGECSPLGDGECE